METDVSYPKCRRIEFAWIIQRNAHSYRPPSVFITVGIHRQWLKSKPTNITEIHFVEIFCENTFDKCIHFDRWIFGKISFSDAFVWKAAIWNFDEIGEYVIALNWIESVRGYERNRITFLLQQLEMGMHWSRANFAPYDDNPSLDKA